MWLNGGEDCGNPGNKRREGGREKGDGRVKEGEGERDRVTRVREGGQG